MSHGAQLVHGQFVFISMFHTDTHGTVTWCSLHLFWHWYIYECDILWRLEISFKLFQNWGLLLFNHSAGGVDIQWVVFCTAAETFLLWWPLCETVRITFDILQVVSLLPSKCVASFSIWLFSCRCFQDCEGNSWLVDMWSIHYWRPWFIFIFLTFEIGSIVVLSSSEIKKIAVY